MHGNFKQTQTKKNIQERMKKRTKIKEIGCSKWSKYTSRVHGAYEKQRWSEHKKYEDDHPIPCMITLIQPIEHHNRQCWSGSEKPFGRFPVISCTYMLNQSWLLISLVASTCEQLYADIVCANSELAFHLCMHILSIQIGSRLNKLLFSKILIKLRM